MKGPIYYDTGGPRALIKFFLQRNDTHFGGLIFILKKPLQRKDVEIAGKDLLGVMLFYIDVDIGKTIKSRCMQELKEAYLFYLRRGRRGAFWLF